MTDADLRIREACLADFDAIWAILEPVLRVGETYAWPRDTTREQGYELWMGQSAATFVVECEGEILGTYYLKRNFGGGGAHVCNCGYIVADRARGRGLATAMCRHSQQAAREHGFRAMQFNFVVATNTGAIKLWQKLDYEVVGRLPRAFEHPSQGLVDALVMYRWLDAD